MAKKTNLIQVRQPKTGQYLKVDRTHGLILDRSDELFPHIPLLKLSVKGKAE